VGGEEATSQISMFFLPSNLFGLFRRWPNKFIFHLNDYTQSQLTI